MPCCRAATLTSWSAKPQLRTASSEPNTTCHAAIANSGCGNRASAAAVSGCTNSVNSVVPASGRWNRQIAR
jgi:hypothetical protein